MNIDKTKLYRNITALLSILLLLTLVSFSPIDNRVNKKENLENNSNEIVEYVFLGDSITNNYTLQKFYPEYPIINSGIGGDRVADVLNGINDRVFKYRPKKVILLIGINDLTHFEEPDYVATNIEMITKLIKLKFPKCEIYIESIYPVNYDWKNQAGDRVPSMEVMIENIKSSNEKIENICKRHHYVYIDIFNALKDSNDLLKDEYSKDGIHLNENGYDVVTKIIRKYAFSNEGNKEVQI